MNVTVYYFMLYLLDNKQLGEIHHMSKVYVFDHPLIQHKLTYIRDKNTGTKEFRELVDEVATLMAFEITRDLPLEEIEVETPVTTAKTKVLSGKKIAIVPILRAGIGMVDGILKLIPAAKVGILVYTVIQKH